MDVSNNRTHWAASAIAGWFAADVSAWMLLGSNLLMIVWALAARWELGTVMWCYWSQSVGIGVLWFFKMLMLREFSTEGFHINGRSVEPTRSTKIKTACFFAMHYGFFHLVYWFFLAGQLRTDRLRSILMMATVFGAYQVFSFLYNRKWDPARRPNIGAMMFFPYARIIPMHVTIIIGGVMIQGRPGRVRMDAAMLLFMGLKTLADLIMHVVERYGFEDRPKENGKPTYPRN